MAIPKIHSCLPENDSGCKTDRQTQVATQTIALANAVDATLALTESLENVLAVVTREEPPSTNKEPSCGPAPPIVPLADRLRQSVWRIEEINSRLMHLLDHLEI